MLNDDYVPRLERRSAVIPEPLNCFTRVSICVTQMQVASASFIAVAGSGVSYIPRGGYACVRSQVMAGVPGIYMCALVVARAFRIYATTIVSVVVRDLLPSVQQPLSFLSNMRLAT